MYSLNNVPEEEQADVGDESSNTEDINFDADSENDARHYLKREKTLLATGKK